METVLLAVNHKGNRKLLKEWLTDHYKVVDKEEIESEDLPIDLCVVDGVSLSTSESLIAKIKSSALSLFVPVLFVTRREDIGLATKNLWKTIDELILTPVEKIELQARVQSLIKTRELSLQLKERDDALLKTTEERYHQLFNFNPDSLFIVDSNGFFRDCNDYAQKFYGYTRAEFLKMKVTDLAAPKLRDKTMDRLIASYGSGASFEWLHCDKNGNEIFVEIKTEPITIGGERFVLASVRDITERTKAQQQLKSQLDELQLWHDVTVGREERVIELKEEVNQLLAELGKPKRYQT